MRKRTIKNMCSTVFWHILYFAPILVTLILCFGAFQGDWFPAFVDNDGDYYNFPFLTLLRSVLAEMFGAVGSSVIYDTFEAVFCENGDLTILPIFSPNSPILIYMEYFVGVYLLHLMVDFILFIPKLCHKWLNYFTRTEDCD